MPTSLHVSGRLAHERIAGLRGRVRPEWGGGGGGGMALNSLLRAGLSLKLPLSCRALKQLEMTKLRVSLNKYFFANQEPRRESP